MSTLKAHPSYVGRFAPSPSGPLHFGSLVSALASFLDARAAGGRWYLRIEDIDPPRESPGAASSILHTLAHHHLHWDGEVLWQSQRSNAYREALAQLQHAGLVYPCNCTRRHLAASGGVYRGHCRQYPPPPAAVTALRLKLSHLPAPFAHLTDRLSFTDMIQGPQQQNLARDVGDAVLVRKDGLFAYQLAVVVDDAFQQITHVVRGCDLLDVSARQIRLFQLLQLTPPAYAHVPVVVGPEGLKLSKQNRAPALQESCAGENLWRALVVLGQNPPAALRGDKPATVIAWAIAHWQRRALTGSATSEPH